MNDNKAKAKAAYIKMCEENMIINSESDELLFIAGFMAGSLSAIDEQIDRIHGIVK